MPRVITPGTAGPDPSGSAVWPPAPQAEPCPRVSITQMPVARGRPGQSLERLSAAAAVADDTRRRPAGPSVDPGGTVVPAAHRSAVVAGEGDVPGLDQGEPVLHFARWRGVGAEAARARVRVWFQKELEVRGLVRAPGGTRAVRRRGMSNSAMWAGLHGDGSEGGTRLGPCERNSRMAKTRAESYGSRLG